MNNRLYNADKQRSWNDFKKEAEKTGMPVVGVAESPKDTVANALLTLVADQKKKPIIL